MSFRDSPNVKRIDVALEEFAEPLYRGAPRPMSDSTVEEHGKTSGDTFATTQPRTVAYEIQNETPRHRWVVSLYLQGYSMQEIGDRTGFTAAYVGTILKQDWARQFMDKIQTATTAQRVMMLLNEAAEPALVRIIKEMDNPKARSAERTTAADKVLDRLFGRAVQPIIHTQVSDPSKMSDAEIERRLAELRATQQSRS